MYGYIYLTENLINGKKYIGMHQSSAFDESYKGSGKILWKAINKYGWDNFKTSILQECSSKEELIEQEKYWINKFNAVESNEFYNLKNGGLGGFALHSGTLHPLYGKRGIDSPNYGKHHSHPHGKIPSISKSKQGKHWYNDGIRNYFLYESEATNLNKGMLPYEYKAKRPQQSEAISGRIRMNDGVTEICVHKTEMDYWLNKGYIRGRLPKHK